MKIIFSAPEPAAGSILPMPATRLHEVYLKDIPTLNAFTGAHADYPMHSDTADKIDFVNAAKRVL